MFEHETNVHTRRPTLYSPVGREWTSSSIVFMRSGWAIEIAPDRYVGVEGITLPDQDRFNVTLGVDRILAACGILATEPQLGDTPRSPAFTGMNVGRGKGRLPPVPPIRRVLNIDRTHYCPVDRERTVRKLLI